MAIDVGGQVEKQADSVSVTVKVPIQVHHAIKQAVGRKRNYHGKIANFVMDAIYRELEASGIVKPEADVQGKGEGF